MKRLYARLTNQTSHTPAPPGFPPRPCSVFHVNVSAPPWIAAELDRPGAGVRPSGGLGQANPVRGWGHDTLGGCPRLTDDADKHGSASLQLSVSPV